MYNENKPLGARQTFQLPDGREVTIETGILAKQADGSAVVRMGDTMLLATVCCKKDAVENTDFVGTSQLGRIAEPRC